jgi:hypothetical protein
MNLIVSAWTLGGASANNATATIGAANRNNLANMRTPSVVFRPREWTVELAENIPRPIRQTEVKPRPLLDTGRAKYNLASAPDPSFFSGTTRVFAPEARPVNIGTRLTLME